MLCLWQRRQEAFWVKFPCVRRPHGTVIISASRNAQVRPMCQQTHDTDLHAQLSLAAANHIRLPDDVPIIPLADADDPERWDIDDGCLPAGGQCGEGRKSNLQTRCASHLRSQSPRKGATVKRRHNKPNHQSKPASKPIAGWAPKLNKCLWSGLSPQKKLL